MQTRRFFARHLQDFPDSIREIVAVHRDSELTLSPFNWVPLRAGAVQMQRAPSAVRGRR